MHIHWPTQHASLMALALYITFSAAHAVLRTQDCSLTRHTWPIPFVILPLSKLHKATTVAETEYKLKTGRAAAHSNIPPQLFLQ
jgi:hypothetical protein